MNGKARANKFMLQGNRYWLNIKKYCLSELRISQFTGVHSPIEEIQGQAWKTTGLGVKGFLKTINVLDNI